MYDKKAWEKAAAFHGHVCGGLATGFKAVEALKETLGADFSPDEEIVCVTENDTCAVDAIQSLLGCTFGKGNLIYRSTGKMAFNFYFRKTGKSIRLYYKGDFSDIPKEQRMGKILETPAAELFNVTPAAFPLPEKARLFPSVTCSVCGEKAREDKIRLQDGKPVCLSCFKEYDR